MYAEPLPAVAYEAYLQGRRLGLPSACALENVPDRGRGIAASAQTPVTRRKIAPRLKERGPASVLALNAPACCLAPRTGKLHPFVQYRPSLECQRVKKLT
jgi:hypothetical protein